MRRSLILAMLSLACVGLVGGCGLFDLFGDGAAETGSSKLIQFSSEAELASYLSGEIAARGSSANRGGMEGDMFRDDVAIEDAPAAMPVPGSGGADGSLAAQDESNGFSGTTLQEAGVDEADVVKTDGAYLYLMDNTRSGASLLRIVAVGAGVPLSVVSETELTGYGQQIYLYDGKVIALTSDSGYYGRPIEAELIAVDFDEAGIPVAVEADVADVADDRPDDATTMMPGFDGMDGMDGVVSDDELRDDEMMSPVEGMPGIEPIEFEYRRPRTVVTVVDVSDPTAPAVLSETTFDGSQSSSRLIDGVLHLVVSNYQSFFFDIMPAMGRPGFDATVTETAAVLPTFTHVDASGQETNGNVVTWEGMYRPTDPDGFGIVTVISLDVDNDAEFTAVGLAAEPGLVYSSTDALYLTDTQYDFSGTERETTDVYKFAYDGRGVVANATGTVPGRILNQYSMSEYNGSLRVASTIGSRFGFFGPVQPPSNGVYVLQENGSTLEMVGSVAGLAPGERIQAARFIGDRGYVVTFEEIDPLFTLDLADAANPRVIGELKVPGFSTFIVPMDANHLLTVGQYVPPPGDFGPWGV